jgi:branched-chain amino acid transport system permease protein
MDWSFIWNVSLSSVVELEAVVFCLAAIGINVQFGYTGLLNFGQSAFLAVAAYGVAVSVVTLGISFWWGILIGILAAVVLALLLGVPTLRLRADYLAIVTIAAAEILRLIVRSASLREVTGGSNGLTGFAEGFYDLSPFDPDARFGIGSVSFSGREFWVLIVGWTLVLLACLVVWLLMRSPWGRVIKGVREDEDAVRSLGKNVYAYKMQALIIGGVLGCLGGFIFALGRAAVQPENYGTELTFFIYTVLLIGGAARVFGPVVGAAIFWLVLSLTDNVLNALINDGLMPQGIMNTIQVGQVRFILVGVALMLLMIYRPQGIFGDRRELALDAR